MTRTIFAACASLVIALVGCSEVGRRTVASPDEYAAYRRYRLAGTVDARLAAGFDYMYRYPSGHWRAHVRRWFSPAEVARVDGAWRDAESLRRFLGAVPKGTQATRASERLVELELTEQHRVRKEREFDLRVHRLDEGLRSAREGRRQLVGEVVAWSQRLAAIRNWGVRTHELDHELIYAFRLSEPEARCVGSLCTKPMLVPYAIPEAKARSERVALFDVVIELERGGVQRAALTGPELFTRIGEAIMLRPVLPTDIRGRVESLSRVLVLVGTAIEASLPEAQCHVDAVSPVLLHRRCDGTELMVVAATDPTEEDRITARAATPGSGAPGAAPTPSEAASPEPHHPGR